MGNNFLTDEEISMLLSNDDKPLSSVEVENEIAITLDAMDQDILGEVGNISMSAASTALSDLTGKRVSITTPKVSLTTIAEIKREIVEPAVIAEVEYTEGIIGHNVLILRASDASIICDLMMGQEPKRGNNDLSELQMSAVGEAMNQMIGSAATAMSILFDIIVNISTPTSILYNVDNREMTNTIPENDTIARITFDLVIEETLYSNIMMILTTITAQRIVSRMTGVTQHFSEELVSDSKVEEETVAEKLNVIENNEIKKLDNNTNKPYDNPINTNYNYKEIEQQGAKNMNSNVTVNRAVFSELDEMKGRTHNNIDLILDVPLEVSVVLGRAKKSIKDVLEFGNGSLIELDKLAEEPVEILVNGKKIAQGEVVVIDENFGVRITDIISGLERVKTLK